MRPRRFGNRGARDEVRGEKTSTKGAIVWPKRGLVPLDRLLLCCEDHPAELDSDSVVTSHDRKLGANGSDSGRAARWSEFRR